ncbi:MAG: lycopene cyclase, partial [Sinomicrobium sp.]|nr:lycopene cyclase [Sinomicrobium sp.]
YKMIRSADFYDLMHREIAAKANMTLLIDTVISIDDIQDNVQVKTATRTYSCEKAFTSVFDLELLYQQRKYPVLQQHFLGWFITSGTAVFDAQTVTFMDFTVPQRGNTRFMYVLPFSETEALVEYTLFSEETLAPEVYEDAIKAYLAGMGISDYTVTEHEKGSIPMTCYDFAAHNSENVLHIGTAGGWTKPSTGYTFLNAVRRSGALASFLKKGLPLTAFGKKTRFWYYDLLFLDVLHRDNALGQKLFSAMFKRNAPERIFRFLDELTTPAEDVKMLFSLPPYPFVKSLLKRIF